ncbi:hypothetical protein BSKO_05015 [Bryopsis sp. KO-2023]|nr:hypothetical protein BSKO_05015 [Bryopsis sp. KO-2023]
MDALLWAVAAMFCVSLVDHLRIWWQEKIPTCERAKTDASEERRPFVFKAGKNEVQVETETTTSSAPDRQADAAKKETAKETPTNSATVHVEEEPCTPKHLLVPCHLTAYYGRLREEKIRKEEMANRKSGAQKNGQQRPKKTDRKNVTGPKPRKSMAEPRQRAANPKRREPKNDQKRAANPKPKKPNADQKQHVASLNPRKPDAEPKQRAANLKAREPKTDPKRGADLKASKPKAGSKLRPANPNSKKPEAVPSPIINRRRRMPKPGERTVLRGMVNGPPPGTRPVKAARAVVQAKTSEPEWPKYKPPYKVNFRVYRRAKRSIGQSSNNANTSTSR